MNRFVRLVLISCLGVCVWAQAATTVLVYPEIGDGPSPAPPESMFHAWDEAEREAGRVQAAWEEGEALSLAYTCASPRLRCTTIRLPQSGRCCWCCWAPPGCCS